MRFDYEQTFHAPLVEAYELLLLEAMEGDHTLFTREDEVERAWELLRAATGVLMESAPGHIDVDEVRDAILATPGVGAVDDLHVWTITSGLEALSAHVLACDDRPPRVLLNEVRAMLRARFRIDHVTIHVETA